MGAPGLDFETWEIANPTQNAADALKGHGFSRAAITPKIDAGFSP
jgi:hypothetical protein